MSDMLQCTVVAHRLQFDRRQRSIAVLRRTLERRLRQTRGGGGAGEKCNFALRKRSVEESRADRQPGGHPANR